MIIISRYDVILVLGETNIIANTAKNVYSIPFHEDDVHDGSVQCH